MHRCKTRACVNTVCACTRMSYLRNPLMCGAPYPCHAHVTQVYRLSCGGFACLKVFSVGFVELPWSQSGDLKFCEHDCCNMIQSVAMF